MEKPLKPAEFAEKKILKAILDSTYQPGDVLPAERVLAGLIGVTRPTLRETLQRLSKEGWITIRQGKPTKVNDYLNNGGLGILSSLAKHGGDLSVDMVSHLLEVRTSMLPDIAQKAVSNDAETILTYLEKSKFLKNSPGAYAGYDWGLQMLMAKATRNPVFNMILNDFAPLYEIIGERYFQRKDLRAASLSYYNDLISALEQNDLNIKSIVEKTMLKTHELWRAIK